VTPNSKDSITFIPRQRRTEDFHQTPALLLVGSLDELGPPPKGRVIAFEGSLSIGRRDRTESGEGESFLVLRDRMISSQHAVITQEGSGYELTDLDSTNGTVVDGVMAQPKAKLRDGALIFVGGYVLVFRILSSTETLAIDAELGRPLGPVPTVNPVFAVVCGKLRKLAESESEVLLTGETGAGKEVYAQAIHDASGRKGRFVAVNCAAIPRELVESELFGYVRGAHSQAMGSKAGIIEDAEGGTLFLDEIGDMAPELQTKLLRFTQDRLLVPVGGTRPRRIDTRILAATSRAAPPSSSGGAGLRADLAARLGAEAIRIPPLRDRIEDIGALVAFMLGTRSQRFELAAFQALCLYTWPGNVRELGKVISSAEALARGVERIAAEHLPAAIASTPGRMRASPSGRASRPPPTPLELEELMRRFSGNMLRVARELERKPALVYRWAKRFKLNADDYRRKDE
jgi:DNA-binding NtrC family response regulator